MWLAQILQILVQCLDPQVYGLWLECLNEIGLVQQQVFLVQLLVSGIEVVHGINVCRNSVLCHVGMGKILFEFFYHNIIVLLKMRASPYTLLYIIADNDLVPIMRSSQMARSFA